MDHQGEVLRVQDPAQPAQGRVQVELLEGVVSGGLNGVCAVYFSLVNRN